MLFFSPELLYNAPIEQQKGLYYHSDPNCSIMSISFTDFALIERIIRLLDKIKTEVTHPELEIILDKLRNLRNRYYLKETQKEEIVSYLKSLDLEVEEKKAMESIIEIKKPMKVRTHKKLIYKTKEPIGQKALSIAVQGYPDFITWGDILISL
jgi:hypothetical protein